MGMFNSMWAGVMGLNSHGMAMNTVADNIANVSTVGFKGGRSNFADIMADSLTVGGRTVNQVGSGSRVQSIQNLMTQGTLETTDVSTDMAISGSGFFAIKQVLDNDTILYSRAGQFSLDQQGYMVNAMGDRLQGYNVDSKGNLVQVATDLRVSTAQSDANATELVEWSLNLDAEADTDFPASQDIDPTDSDTYNYMTTVRTYDSLGIAHDLSLFFQKTETTGDTYGGSYPAVGAGDAPITNVWKVAVFESEDGTYTQANITDTADQANNVFYMHFDSDGHLVGTSVGAPAEGDVYTSAATVTNVSSAASNRVGETLTYEGNSGAQKYISSLDVLMTSSADGDTITLGNNSYTLSGGSDDARGANLADAINANMPTNGFYAVYDNATDTLTIHSTGTASAGTNFASTNSSTTVTGDSLSDVINAINSGKAATGAIYLDTASLVDGHTVTINGTTFTYDGADNTGALFTSAADLAADISGIAGLTAVANGNSIMITASAVGDTGNAITLASAQSSIAISASTLTGGMDDTATTDVVASNYTGGGAGSQLRLSRSMDTGAAATITMGTTNSLGQGLSLNFASFTHDVYASDAEPTTSPVTETSGERTLRFNWMTAYGSSQPQDITFDFTPTGQNATTQSAGANEAFYLYQDGFTHGSLISLDIGQDGIITGLFSNGTNRTVGQVILVNFAAPDKLARVGDNMWKPTTASGEPVYNTPGNGGVGTIESASLERSNVDLAEELVRMINYQRAFQANSKTISTVDQMLAELMNIKR